MLISPTTQQQLDELAVRHRARLAGIEARRASIRPIAETRTIASHPIVMTAVGSVIAHLFGLPHSRR